MNNTINIHLHWLPQLVAVVLFMMMNPAVCAPCAYYYAGTSEPPGPEEDYGEYGEYCSLCECLTDTGGFVSGVCNHSGTNYVTSDNVGICADANDTECTTLPDTSWKLKEGIYYFRNLTEENDYYKCIWTDVKNSSYWHPENGEWSNISRHIPKKK